jgi:hypothetical protein
VLLPFLFGLVIAIIGLMTIKVYRQNAYPVVDFRLNFAVRKVHTHLAG